MISILGFLFQFIVVAFFAVMAFIGIGVAIVAIFTGEVRDYTQGPKP